MPQDLEFMVGDNAAGQLLGFVQRVERMNEEIEGLTEDRKEIFEEAKGFGYDVKTLRKVIALRKMDPDKREQDEAMLDTYMAAIIKAEKV